MKIAVTGASGLIGGALLPALRERRPRGPPLVRRTPRTADEHRWDPQHHRIDPDLLADVDAVINLAGAPIRPRPFTSGYKARLITSRAGRDDDHQRGDGGGRGGRPGPDAGAAVGVGRRLLRRHRVARRDREGPGRAATSWPRCAPSGRPRRPPAEAAGIRVAHLRSGLVLDRSAMLVQVLGTVFRLGLGGRMGNGRQYWPWISLDRRDRRDAAPADRRRLRTGQPHRARAGDERRVHRGTRAASCTGRPCCPCRRSR